MTAPPDPIRGCQEEGDYGRTMCIRPLGHDGDHKWMNHGEAIAAELGVYARCARCRIGIKWFCGEFCWFCCADLCGDCWETYGHCGHPEAVELNDRAGQWQPGDPLLPAPWDINKDGQT